MTTKQLQQLVEQIKEGHLIDAAEAATLADMPNKTALYAAANDVRRHFMGDHFDLCSIINAKSGRCSEDCKWCSQSHCHETGVEIYPMIGSREAVDMAVHNRKKGVARFSLVTSGKRLNDRELDQAIAIFSDIKQHTDIGLCASMGLLDKAQLQRLKDICIERYHCNIETAPSLFPTLCTTHTIDDKVRTIRWAQEVGMPVCSGGIIGMGETMAQRIEMALFVRQLGVVSIPINVLMPINGTQLAKQQPLSIEEILTTFALFRLINPRAMIRMAGGRAAFADHLAQALNSGINASIVGDMLTTSGSNGIDDDMKAFAAQGFTF